MASQRAQRLIQTAQGVNGLDTDGILARRSAIPPRELAPSRTQSGALVPTYAFTSLTLVS